MMLNDVERRESVDGRVMDKPWRNLGIPLPRKTLPRPLSGGHDRRKAESGSCPKLQLDNSHYDHVLF